MKRMSLVVAVLVFVSVLFVGSSFLPEVRATTRYVGGSGPGNYTSIQAAIDSASPGETIYVHNGTYYENIIVGKALSLIGEDRNMTVVDGGGTGDVVYVTADWVNITGFTVRNSGPHAGVELDSVEYCLIADNTVSPNGIYGIRLYHSNHNAIADNIVSSSEWTGISLSGSGNNTVTNNSVSGGNSGIFVGGANNTLTNNLMVECGIDIGGSIEELSSHTIDISNMVNDRSVYYWKNAVGGTVPPGAGQVILANCTGVIVENQNVSSASLGVQVGYSSSITIANNTASNNENGIHLFHSTDSLVANNIVSWNNRYGIRLSSSDNNTIANNTIANNTAPWTPGIGILLATSENVTVTNNIVSSSGAYGIRLYFSDNVTIAYNTVSSNHRMGILLFHSTNGRVSNNTVTDNDQGIYLTGSSNNAIAGNNASSNGDGIFLWHSSTNTVSANTVCSNNANGITLLGSSNNTVTMNVICSNRGRGISVESWYEDASDSNRIYHNNILNNTNQAFDDNNANYWDNGYPSGGNFWSDYNGTDEKSGSDQDRPGSDGIGDTAYDILGGSRDRYPLTTWPPPERQESVFEQAWFWVAVAVVIFVVLLVLFILIRRREKPEAP